MVVKLSVRIPADASLNLSIINIFPFILLLHSLFSAWSHTTPGIFTQTAPIFTSTQVVFGNNIDRVFGDLLIIGQVVVIVVVIVLDYTLFNFIGGISECCKDEMVVPPAWAGFESA
jgi:hypothetical protein